MICPDVVVPDPAKARAYGFAVWRPGADRGIVTRGVFASDEAALEHASRLLGTGEVLFVVVSRDDAPRSEYVGQWSWIEPASPAPSSPGPEPQAPRAKGRPAPQTSSRGRLTP